MIPYLIALVGGYLIGEGMEEKKVFAKGGILDADVKDNVKDYLVHKLDTEDFDVYIDNSVSPAQVTVTCTEYDNIDIQNFLREANEALFDGNGDEEYNYVKGDLPEFLTHIMAKGGEVSFQDKVDAVAKRLVGTKVPKKLQEQYGPKYNKEEAQMAARRIIGSQRAKYGEKSFSKGGMVEVKQQFGYSIEKLSPKQRKVYEDKLHRIKNDKRFDALTDKDMADYVNGWYGEDIVSNMDFTGKQSFDFGIKVLSLYEAQKQPEFWEEELMVAEKGIKVEGGYPINKTISITKKAIKFFEEKKDEKQVAHLKKYLAELEQKKKDDE